jgi:hypothetical protein
VECKQLILVGTTDSYVRFEVFTAVTMKNAVFWDEPHGVSSQKTSFYTDSYVLYQWEHQSFMLHSSKIRDVLWAGAESTVSQSMVSFVAHFNKFLCEITECGIY